MGFVHASSPQTEILILTIRAHLQPTQQNNDLKNAIAFGEAKNGYASEEKQFGRAYLVDWQELAVIRQIFVHLALKFAKRAMQCFENIEIESVQTEKFNVC